MPIVVAVNKCDKYQADVVSDYKNNKIIYSSFSKSYDFIIRALGFVLGRICISF